MRALAITAVLLLVTAGCAAGVGPAPELPASTRGEPELKSSASASRAAALSRKERRPLDVAGVPESQSDVALAKPSSAINGNEASSGETSIEVVRDCEDAATKLMWAFAREYMPATVAALEAGPQFPSPDRRVTFQSETGRVVKTGPLTAYDSRLVFWLGMADLRGLGWVRIDPTSGDVEMACAGRIAGCDAFPGEEPWYRPPFENRLQLMVRAACGAMAQ